MANAAAAPGKVVQLIEGQWAQGVDLSPLGGGRPLNIWLPVGTLLHDVERDKSEQFRNAVTYFGYPVRIETFRDSRRTRYFFKELDDYSAPAFRLTRDVFCAGETAPIRLEGNCLRTKEQPKGEGYELRFERVDADGDGQPDRKNDQEFYRVFVTLDREDAEAVGTDTTFTFDLYETDLNLYESSGALFRLDRPHPRVRFKFLDQTFLPCGSVDQRSLERKDVSTVFVETSAEAGFDLWRWFKLTIGGGARLEKSGTDAEKLVFEVSSKTATTFRQWGEKIVYDQGLSEAPTSVPFMVEKTIECRPEGQGAAEFGDAVASVKVQVWNPQKERNIRYEFNDRAEFWEVDDKLRDFIERPVFISVNEVDQQSWVLNKIKMKYPGIDHETALFVFGQLNNTCFSENRSACAKYSKPNTSLR